MLVRFLRAVTHARLTKSARSPRSAHPARGGAVVYERSDETVYNLCRIHGSLRVTPAMAAGLTDRVWDISELLYA